MQMPTFKKLSARQLSDAIQRAVNDQTMRTRAAQLGEHVRKEDGVGNAVQLISKLIISPHGDL